MISYYVALHGANWPTMQALQQCIDRHSWPVRVGAEGHPQWTRPLAETPNTLGMPVVFKGEPMQLEASLVTLGPGKPFAYSLDVSQGQPDNDVFGYKATKLPQLTFKPLDINEQLASIGATDVRFGNGDRVLTLTFRSSKREYQAGFYVMAALIKCFEGYGFSADGHGKSTYADLLTAEAAMLAAEGTDADRP